MAHSSYMTQTDDVFSASDNYVRDIEDMFAYVGEQPETPRSPKIPDPLPKIGPMPEHGGLHENLFKNHALKIAHKSPTVHDVIRGGFERHVHGHAKRAQVEHEDAMQQAIQDLVLDPGALNLHHYDPQQHGDFRSFFRKMLGKSIYNQQKAEGRELSGLGGEERSLELTPSGQRGGQSQRTKEGARQPKIINRIALRQDEKDEAMHGLSLKDKISRLLERDPAMQWGEIVRQTRAPTEEARKAMAEMQADGLHGDYKVPPRNLLLQSPFSPSIRDNPDEIANRMAAFINANPRRDWAWIAQQAGTKLGMRRGAFHSMIESLRAAGKIPKSAVIPPAPSGRGRPRTAYDRSDDDMFAYAESPLPTSASKRRMPSPGSAMKPILPALGKPAKLPSPIPPDTKVAMTNSHPESTAGFRVPRELRAGNPDTLQQRIPRPPKPRYKLQVPMKEAFDRAHAEIMNEMNTVTHPEDKQRYQEELDDLEKVFVSGSERLMTRFLEDHVGWKTFNHLVQSLKDQEPGLTSRKGIFARDDADIFRYIIPPVGPAREFSSTQFELDGDIALAVREMSDSIPDADLAEGGREDKPHITVKFGLHTNNAMDVAKVVSDFGPVEVTFGKVSIFPAKEATVQRADDQYDVVKVDVDGDRLHELNKLISASLECTDTHPEYKPHATLAYVKPGEGAKYVGDERLAGKKAIFEALIFSGKDREKVPIYLDVDNAVAATGFAREPDDMFAYADTRAEPKPVIPKATSKAMPGIVFSPPSAVMPPTVKAGGIKPPTRKMGLHPIPEAKIDPWWHEMPHTTWLRHAEEIGRKPMPGSGINSAYMVHLAGDTPMGEYKAIWKSRDDDQTAAARPWTIPEGNPHGHEAAAWEIAHLLGMGGMVPPTVSRENRGQIGSAQHFVPGQQKAYNSSLPFGPPGNSQLPLAAAFDALTMNTDRHMKNWLVDPESGQLTLIDHGLLFPHTHKRPLIGAGEILNHAWHSRLPVPKEALQWESQWPHIERSMKRNGLTDEQITLTQSRLAALADAARNGETFRDWLKKSGIGMNYQLGLKQ